MTNQQPARPLGPRPVRPIAPAASPAPSHLIRLPSGPDGRLFRGWGITL